MSGFWHLILPIAPLTTLRTRNLPWFLKKLWIWAYAQAWLHVSIGFSATFAGRSTPVKCSEEYNPCSKCKPIGDWSLCHFLSRTSAPLVRYTMPRWSVCSGSILLHSDNVCWLSAWWPCHSTKSSLLLQDQSTMPEVRDLADALPDVQMDPITGVGVVASRNRAPTGYDVVSIRELGTVSWFMLISVKCVLFEFSFPWLRMWTLLAAESFIKML